MKIKINSMKFKHSGKTTVCVIKSVYKLDWNEVNIRSKRNVKKQLGLHEDALNDVFNITVVGKTTCKFPDKFNKVLGERIAESKAKIKLGEKLQKINDIIKDALATSIYMIATNDSKFNKFITVEKKHLNDLK